MMQGCFIPYREWDVLRKSLRTTCKCNNPTFMQA